jgi:hypothetical protein
MLVPINRNGLALSLELTQDQINEMIDSINEFGYEARFVKYYYENGYYNGQIVYPNFYEIDETVCGWEGVDTMNEYPLEGGGENWEYRTHPESY